MFARRHNEIAWTRPIPGFAKTQTRRTAPPQVRVDPPDANSKTARTAPQRERIDPSDPRVGFTEKEDNSRGVTERAH